MKLSLNNIAAVAAAVLMAASCGVVSFTGRRQILMYSDSEITALSDQTYTEFMKEARVSTDAEATKMLKSVGNTMVSSLESYMKKTGQEDALSGLTWEFQLVDSAAVNAFCLPNGKIVFFEGILKYAATSSNVLPSFNIA